MSGVLGAGIDSHRCLAAQALGRIGGEGAVEALIEALLDEDEDVRTDAAAALSRLADRRAGKQLLENLLGDPCGDVKTAAVEALVRLRYAEVIPWLRRLVKGRDGEIVWDDEEFLHGGWDSWVDLQLQAIRALADLGVEEAVGDIVEAIDDEQGQDLSATAFKALAALGEPGMKALAAFVDDKEESRRRRAAFVLAGTKGDAAGEAVRRALADRSGEVRLAAVRGLAAWNPADERLAPLFADDDPGVRAETVKACGHGHRDQLISLLADQAPAVQGAVLGLVAERPDLLPAEAVADMAGCSLRGPVSALAAAALAAVAPKDAVAALGEHLGDSGQSLDGRLGAVMGLAKVGGLEAVRALVDILGCDQRQIRLQAMASLAGMAAAAGEWPNPPADALLAALTGDLVPPPETSGEAEVETKAPADGEPGEENGEGEASPPAFPTSTLESILGTGSAVQPADLRQGAAVELTGEDLEFLSLAQSRKLRKRRVPVMAKVPPHEDVPRFAARVLGGVPRTDVALELAMALKEEDQELRLAAADSLARIGETMGSLPEQVVEALLGMLPNPDRQVRLSVIRGLGFVGGRQAIAVLADHLGDDDGLVRSEAVRGLSRLGEAGPGIERMLEDGDPTVRLAAAGALADGGSAQALGRLVEFAFAFDGHHRRQAARLLRRVDAAAASVRFVAVLKDKERMRVWPVAIEALEELNREDLTADETDII